MVPDERALALSVHGEEVEAEGVLEEADPRVRARPREEDALDLEARRVAGRVEDPGERVAAFLREVELAVGPAVEGRAPLDELAHVVRALAADHAHDVLGAEPASDLDRVVGVLLPAVLGRVERGGDPALGVARVRLLGGRLRRDDHGPALGRLEGGPQAGDAAPDHEHVGPSQREVARVEPDEIPAEGQLGQSFCGSGARGTHR